MIKLWQWSYGADNASGMDSFFKMCSAKKIITLFFPFFKQKKNTDMFELPEKYEQVENVRFNCNRNGCEMYVITCSNGIIFGQWVR